MEPAIVAAIVALIASLSVALVSAWMDRQGWKERQETGRESVLARYSEPLAAAAFDLQHRIRNILEKSFLETYGDRRSKRRQDAIRSTLFIIAQYFAWTEILRQEIQFLSFLRKPDKTREIAELQAEVARIFATDDYGKEFMIWREEQRGIGEWMISQENGERRCIGYATFWRKYENDPARWLLRLEKGLIAGIASKDGRLEDIQHLLCKLVRLLDPLRLRYDESQLSEASRR
jgi:hypothetical protein